MNTKVCTRCAADKPLEDFYKATSAPDGHKSICKDCWKAAATGAGTGVARVPSTRSLQRATSSSRTVATDKGYIASRRLLALWEAVRTARLTGDEHPMNLLFLGPSGSGKTVAAEHLASIANLPFVKVDAASMTDPESWFGTREIVAVSGVAVTTYRPSEFVLAITTPCVLLIDEINRVRDEHRQILIPLLDGTHQVTNPLTGEVIAKHPQCYVIMSGNRGLQFTGTYPVDPALMTRSLVEVFDYLQPEDETRVAVTRTGVDESTARLFVRFASETRSRASLDPDMSPVSTREVLAACALVKAGLGPDDASVIAIMNGVSDEGGVESIRHRLQTIWTGIRPAVTPNAFTARS